MKLVQFTDSTKTVVQSVFSGPQNPEVWPDLEEIEESDPRYLAFFEPPSPVETTNPLEKLRAFLLENPDVAAILK